MDFPELRMTRVHLSNSENIEDIDSGREGHGWSKAEDAEVKMSGLGINLAWCTCPVHHHCPHVHRCIIIDHQLFPNCTEGREEIEKTLGRESKNQNGNLRWHLPLGGGGLEGVSFAIKLF